jgi:hypothetical protein
MHIPNIHALYRIRTHDPGFQANEDSACLRPIGYRDWPVSYYRGVKHSAILYKLILHNAVYLRVRSITQEYIASKDIINCVSCFYCLHLVA